jgi:hypothetical protein
MARSPFRQQSTESRNPESGWRGGRGGDDTAAAQRRWGNSEEAVACGEYIGVVVGGLQIRCILLKLVDI